MVTRRGPTLRKSDRTCAQILEAARSQFAQRGYAGTTLRDVAAGASIDPAMVIRYFGSKAGLFAQATTMELNLPDLAACPPARRGEALVRHFLSLWEGPGCNRALPILLRSAAVDPASAERVRAVFTTQVLPAIRRVAPADQAPTRAGLVVSQLLGIALARYILRIEPIAGLTREELVTGLAPAIQRYLDGS